MNMQSLNFYQKIKFVTYVCDIRNTNMKILSSFQFRHFCLGAEDGMVSFEWGIQLSGN